MAEIIPFNGVLYNPEKVDGSAVTAPPYDIVTPEFKDTLYSRSPYNIIRIDFGKDKDGDNEEENRHTRAAGELNSWLEQEVLRQDDKPAFYCYEISYAINGETKRTRGILGAVRIDELGSGSVHPHEETYSKPKSDRLNILRYCMANVSPIFSLYGSQEKIASSILEKTVKEKAFIEAKDENGFIHRLWQIDDEISIEAIKKEMSDKDIFIADGHHRYETALTFKKEMDAKGLNKTGKEPFNYVLMFLSNIEDEGLTLLPTHRIVEVDSDIRIRKALEEHFNIQKISSEGMPEKQAVQKMFDAMHSSTHVFGLYLTNSDTYYALSFSGSDMELDLHEKLRDLDVTVLHKFIFKKLLNVGHYEYEMDPEIAVERAKKGSFEAVFFLNSTKLHDVKEVALAGERMPPKSTYFYPKLLTGMVIYKF